MTEKKKVKEKEEEKEEKVEEEVVVEKSLAELVLDTRYDKYKLIPVAARWAKELRKKEEYRNTPITQIVGIALKEILTQKVAMEDIIKLPPIVDTYKKPLRPNDKR